MSLILDQIDITLNGQKLLDNICCCVDGGEVLSVLGPSGCGKSSLLNLICGTLPNSFGCSGQVMLDGVVLNNLPPYKRQVGLQFQDHLLFPHMTVGENLAFALPAHYRKSQRQERAEQALADCGMSGFFELNPAMLSGGQKARISLMRTLLSEPKALLLDEPFSKLDATLRSSFRHFVFQQIQSRSMPALMVTHDEQDIPDKGLLLKL
ncbi:ATP-binding cassette domain-containing protein [Salinisphaera sp. G21_0]|uniref:ATP-binding cassette domain-containing protein n=1 Tax=Salinisphaera sp. G21_0 TaxID=2821094 RepID=UPI001ADD11D3|nr:ATP-binding cassette domain-containing protein [Salinisphaera sp. G21_0]MBO9482176.1 ATP-binding cassette domain-containing protein [Salinisphaera sp. G21_0]